MTPEIGSLVTVEPHVTFDGRGRCERWHGRVRAYCRVSLDWIWVQQLRPADGVWSLGGTTQVRIDALVPIEVQLDLFGNPAGGAR